MPLIGKKSCENHMSGVATNTERSFTVLTTKRPVGDTRDSRPKVSSPSSFLKSAQVMIFASFITMCSAVSITA
jgi:hypothetical protein